MDQINTKLYTADNFKLIHKFYTSAGFSNQRMYIYLATDLIPGECEFDEDENIDIHHVDLEEVYNMISKNEIEDAKTSIGILLAKELI